MKAMSKKEEVEALANALVKGADAVNAKIKELLATHSLSRDQAYTLLQQEQALRVQANALYCDAIQCVMEDLEEPQAKLMDTLRRAEQSLTRIKTTQAFFGFVANLVLFATALNAAKAGPILAALREVRESIAALEESGSDASV
jgi:hypothetical protein